MSQLELSPGVVKLCRLLKSKKTMPLPELEKESRECSAHEVLAEALNLDLIQIGRQGYTRTISDSRPRKGPDGKQARDDNGRAILDHEYKVHPDSEWTWLTAKNQAYRTTLPEILAEVDENAPPLHIRLTTAGLAASSGKIPAAMAA